MSLYNPHWITFGGEPVTGMTPTQVVVHSDGVPLTEWQSGGVEHAHQQFCMAVNLTCFPKGFHASHEELQDGTRVEMSSINGVHQVHVWPTGGGVERHVLRGFVISPRFIGGATVDATKDCNILLALRGPGKWTPFQAPYAPGIKREALNYCVASTRRKGPSAAQGVMHWTDSPLRGVRPASDDAYNDVFSVFGSTLYKNAVPVYAFGSAPPGNALPIVFELDTTLPAATPPTDKYRVVTAHDTGVIKVPASGAHTVAYNFWSYFNPLAPGNMFVSSVDVFDSPSGAVVARFMGYNHTFVSVTQIWTAVVTLTAEAPFATLLAQYFSQVGAVTPMNSLGGWTSAYSTTIDEFPIDPRSLLIHYGYTGADAQYTQPIYSGTPAVTGASSWTRFDRTYTDNYTFKINEAEDGVITRQVVIASARKDGTRETRGTWPLSTLYAYYSGGDYRKYPAEFGGIDVHTGDSVALLQTAHTEKLDHADDSLCRIEIPGVPDRLYDLAVSRRVTGDITWAQDSIRTDEPAIGAYLTGRPVGRSGHMETLVPGLPPAPITTRFQTAPKVATNTVSVVSRDFFFSDRENEVFSWVELEITAEAQNEATETGTCNVKLAICLRAFGVLHKRILFQKDYAKPATVTLQVPWGVNFGTSVLGFSYHAPSRPPPIYAPKWQEQGLCPFIAYTTKAETEHGVKPRVAAFFRMQFAKVVTGIDFEFTSFPDTALFSPYILENSLGYLAHIPGAENEVAAAMYGSPAVLQVGYPDPLLLDNVFGPFDESKHHAKFYRT